MKVTAQVDPEAYSFKVKLPAGAYRISGQVNTYYGNNNPCIQEDGGPVLRVTSGQVTHVVVGCGLP